MSRKKGTMIYVPAVIVDEVEDIRHEDEIDSRPEAFKRLAKYARVGREVNRIRHLDFSKSKRRTPVDKFPNVAISIPFCDPITGKKYKKRNSNKGLLDGLL